jgi:hypothetical protein
LFRSVRPAVLANRSRRLLRRCSGLFSSGSSVAGSSGGIAGSSGGIAGSVSGIARSGSGVGSGIHRRRDFHGSVSSGISSRSFFLLGTGAQHEGNRNGAPDLCIHRQLPQFVSYSEKGKVNSAPKHRNNSLAISRRVAGFYRYYRG